MIVSYRWLKEIKKSGFVVKLLTWKKKQQKEKPFYGKTKAEVFSHMEKASKQKNKVFPTIPLLENKFFSF